MTFHGQTPPTSSRLGFERLVSSCQIHAQAAPCHVPSDTWRDEVEEFAQVAWAEGEYIETVRRAISPLLASVPSGVDDFIDWFEDLKETGPGQGDELFPWLAERANREEATGRRRGQLMTYWR